MAFDRPIEADRIDDLSLFSAFIRSPLWILGGVLGGSGSNITDDDEAKGGRRLDDDDEKNNQQRPQGGPPLTNNSRNNRDDYARSPRSVLVQRGITGTGSQDSNESSRESQRSWTSDYSSDRDRIGAGLKRTKKMSWSDESGQNLVEYVDESTTKFDASKSLSVSASVTKPVRSVMKRSLRTEAVKLENSQDVLRYIPKMNRNENGAIIPTRPYGSDQSGNGVESPQWGWYINTTPPTPEMYHSTTMKNKKKTEAQSRHPCPTLTSQEVGTMPQQAQQNRVFQNLQGTKTQMAWPSIPI